MGQQKAYVWQKQSEEIVFSKFGRSIVDTVFKMPDGALEHYYIKQEKSAAGIVALTDNNMVILVRQYRPGPNAVLDELPGGYFDPADENAIAAVERELLEETGYAGQVQLVTTAFDDAYSTMQRYCFVATNCRKISTGSLDEHEYIELVELSLEDFRKHLQSGQLTDIEVGYIGLDYLKLL